MIDIVPNKRIKNRVTIHYLGYPVASAMDFENGWFEVIPRATYFRPYDRLVKMMKMEQIEELCERSYVKHYVAKGQPHEAAIRRHEQKGIEAHHRS